MWECPKCSRTFKNNNQIHSCRSYTQEEHLQNKDDLIKELYSTLLNTIKMQVGTYKIDPVHCCVHLVTQSIFVSIKPQKSALKIFFVSKEPIKSKRIIKKEIISANRINNTLKLFKMEDIDRELIDWLQAAYDLTL